MHAVRHSETTGILNRVSNTPTCPVPSRSLCDGVVSFCKDSCSETLIRVLLCLQSLLIREEDVKSCWTGRHLNLWGYFTAVLVLTDEHSHFQDWFVCFPAQSPLHLESSLLLRLQTKFPRGTSVGGKFTQLAGSRTAPCLVVVYLLISGERLWIGGFLKLS